MSETPHNQSPERPDWSKLSTAEHHMMLLNGVHTARLWLEEGFQDPGTSAEEREQLRAKKAAADQALVSFELEQGIIPPPSQD